MSEPAPVLSPPKRLYRGALTDPARWPSWEPRRGDVLVCTPPKSGTTWTQTILAMLLTGRVDLPDRLPVLSPWVDADLGVPAAEVAAALARQAGRRVVKTHTPADGFPVWDGVTVVAVYRHPLDVFFSLRRHVANRATAPADHPMLRPLGAALRAFLDGAADPEDLDRDTLATLALHYRETVCAGRLPGLKRFHYADMLLDPRRAVARLAEAVEVAASPELLDAVTEATGFEAMRAKAADFAPVGGTGFWRSDAGFFDSASSGKWAGQIAAQDLARYEARLAALIPDPSARRWLECGAS